MKKTFPKLIHLPVEIKKDFEKMCIDLDTDGNNFIKDLIEKTVKEYVEKIKQNRNG